MVTSLNDYNDDNNPPLLSPIPPPSPELPRWVHSSHEATSDLASDPTYQCHTCSQFQRYSSLLAQVLDNYDPDTFVEAFGHLEWDTMMNEEYHSLLANDTWDLVHLSKG